MIQLDFFYGSVNPPGFRTTQSFSSHLRIDIIFTRRTEPLTTRRNPRKTLSDEGRKEDVTGKETVEQEG